MHEITDAQYREYQAYSALGTPEDVGKKIRDLDKVKSEAAERRQKLQEAEKKIADLDAKVPEGAVVLTGDDAKAHAAMVAAGKTLKQVDADLKRLGELETKDKAREREDAVRATAKAEGLDPDKAVKAFANLNGADTLKFETGEVQVQGKNEKAPAGFVTTADGKRARLGEWLAAEHPYVDLKPSGAPNGGAGSGQGAIARETPAMRGAAPQLSTSPKTAEDYKKAVDSTATYTL